jgi:hypothetical protein
MAMTLAESKSASQEIVEFIDKILFGKKMSVDEWVNIAQVRRLLDIYSNFGQAVSKTKTLDEKDDKPFKSYFEICRKNENP